MRKTGKIFKTAKERRAFIDNYRAWELLCEARALNAKFYVAKMSTGGHIVATESLYAEYGGEINEAVKYSLILSGNDGFPNCKYYRFYSPSGCGITTVMEYLKFHSDIEWINCYSCSSELPDKKIFSDVEIDVIKAMQASNMKIRRAAGDLNYSPGSIVYHINHIKEKTGFDARVFDDLVKLGRLVGVVS